MTNETLIFNLEEFRKRTYIVPDVESTQDNAEESSNLTPPIDLTRFQHVLVSILDLGSSKAAGQSLSHIDPGEIRLAIASERFLIVTNDYCTSEESGRKNKRRQYHSGVGDVRILLDLLSSRRANEDDGSNDRPSALAWVNDRVILVGFDSGLVLACNCALDDSETDATSLSNQLRKPIFEFRAQISSVRSIHVYEDRIWILHENSYLIAVRIMNC